MDKKKPSVLLISVDALNPKFVYEGAKLGVQLPNINKYFIEGGTSSREGVKSVFPTFTYPCHQSIITGTNPATHGAYNNGIFDPDGTHKGAWHWFVSDKVENLWQRAKESGYVSASVAFPTSVSAKGDYIAPEYWWDGSAFDSQFIDSMALPQGLIKEMEEEIGLYAGGLDLSEDGDKQRFKASMWMINQKLAPKVEEKPFFLSVYFASFDENSHNYGVYSKEAAHSLEQIDGMVGEMIERVHQITSDDVVVCLVSDHGMLDNKFNISPNVKLKEAGLIDVDENGTVTNWRAWSQRAGGTSEIRLKDNNDQEAKERLKQLMAELLKDSESGILEVLDREAAVERGGFPLADYVLVSQKGYEIRDDVMGAYCTEKLSQCAQHGYSEEFEEMKASFFIEGKGISKGENVGALRLIDIAPTLANIMDFELKDAEGVNILG